MGASVAKSSNIAEAVAEVSNSISQDTYANSNVINTNSQSVLLSNCSINLDGNFDVKLTAKNMIKNEQISKASQDANVKTDIQQKMLQTATSDAGFTVGIGYAEATNAASMTANISNSIAQSMSSSVQTISNGFQSFTCDGSTIKAKNMMIDLNNSSDIISKNVLENTQVAKVVSAITQSIEQTASASSGMSFGALIVIIIIIAVASGMMKKKDGSGSGAGGSKAVIVFFSVSSFFIIIFLLISYFLDWPPFFDKHKICNPDSVLGIGNKMLCVEIKNDSIPLDHTPLRYYFGIADTSNSKSSSSLIELVISSKKRNNTEYCKSNGGYNKIIYDAIQKDFNNYETIRTNLTPRPDILPNILYLPKKDGSYIQIPPEYIFGLGGNDENDILGVFTPGKCTVSGNEYFTKNGEELEEKDIQPADINYKNVLAMLNIDGWNAYLQKDENKYFSRYVLCDMLDIDCTVYMVSGKEIVNVPKNGSSTQLSNTSGNIGILYTKSQTSGVTDISRGFDTPGSLSGKTGVIENKSYKFHKFISNIKWYFLGFVLFLLFLLTIKLYVFNTNKSIKDINSPNLQDNSVLPL